MVMVEWRAMVGWESMLLPLSLLMWRRLWPSWHPITSFIATLPLGNDHLLLKKNCQPTVVVPTTLSELDFNFNFY
jgi:hypothetical protein